MDVTAHDDPESADAGALDLTPRSHDAAPRAVGARRRVLPWLVGLVVLGAIGALFVSLMGSTTYFYNVDQAVAKKAEIGDKRVRLQGNVIKGSERGRTDDSVQGYTIAYNGVSVKVVQTGDVPDLFGPSIPIVIEGRFVGNTFHSDRVLVKHDETYDEDNSGRIKDAEADARKNASSSTIPAP